MGPTNSIVASAFVAFRTTVGACLLVYFSSSSVLAGVTPWVGIEIENGHLLVASEISGIAGNSVIDTGAAINGINSSFLETHDLNFRKGKKIKIRGIQGEANRSSYQMVPVKLFGADLKFRGVVEMNIGKPDRQLILGAGFLQQFVFQFDYPNKRMRAITRDVIDMRKQKNVESRRDPQTGQPIVKVRLNDEVDVWLVMDTGNATGVITKRKIAVKKNWHEKFDTTKINISGANASGEMESFRLPQIDIGPYKVNNARVLIPAEGTKMAWFKKDRDYERATGTRRKDEGLLGYDVLKNFVVTVDYKSGAVHVEIPAPEQEGSNKEGESVGG